MTATLTNADATDWVDAAIRLTNDQLLEFYEIYSELVDSRKGIKNAKLWKFHTEAFAALEAEVARRKAA